MKSMAFDKHPAGAVLRSDHVGRAAEYLDARSPSTIQAAVVAKVRMEVCQQMISPD